MMSPHGHHDAEKSLGQPQVEEAQLADHSEHASDTSSQDIAYDAAIDKVQTGGQKRLELTREITQASSVATKDLVEPTPPRPKRWYDKINPLKMRTIPPVPEERIVSREHGANFFSKLTFQWMAPLMTVGYLRPLELGDIWLVNPERKAEVMTRKVMGSFKRRATRGDKHSLFWALHEAFRDEFWLGGLCNLLSSIFQVMTPFTTRYLIQYATDAYEATRSGTPAPHISHGIGLALGITFMQIFQSLGTNHFIYRGFMVGGEARAVLITAIFEKALKISNRAKAGGRALEGEKTSNGIDAESLQQSKDSLINQVLKKKKNEKENAPQGSPDKATGVAGDGTGWSNGKIVNLMSVDTYRVDQASGLFHLTWTSPVAIAITLVVLCINLGASALAGYALLVLSIPLLTKSIKSLFKRRKRINKITDQRVSLTQEILASVRFVKYFGWESSFLERLKEIRSREIRAIQILLAVRNAINAVSMSMPVFSSMLAFITFSLSNHSLSPARIFSSLALFNALRMPLNLLPLVIGQVTDAWASLGRIQAFLLAEERVEDTVWDEHMEHAIELGNASFTWERTPDQKKEDVPATNDKADSKIPKSSSPKEVHLNNDNASEQTHVEPFKLHDLNFTVKRNELLAVIGTVGSGKSSLLSALAGDMRLTDGTMKLGATRAFCPQYAWIQNASLKENILFGRPYDSKWYNRVLYACALRPDLEILPAGDRTEIGERGITVSGGQKQRLNISRAIYFNADIILMDDPLSAVDAHVGRHIMDEAICGILKDKCRILATHQLHVLNRCDRIIWMDEGRIQAIDTFDNLMNDHVGFQKLMATTAQEETKQKAENEDGDEIEEEKKEVKKKKKPKQLMVQEERAVKSVGWSVWGAYVKASGSVLFGPLVILALLLSQGANIATSLWLSYWTSNKYPHLTLGDYIGVYVSLGFLQALLMYIYSTLLSVGGTNASKTLLQGAITRVLRAPMSFFDTTPLGRITNRFSRDIDTMDNNLTDAMRMYFLTLAMITAVFALIISFFHYFAIALGPLFFLFIFAAGYYRASAREVKRHESVLRSHVFARFSEAVTGTSSIRAYRLQDFFTTRIREAIDDMDSAYFLTFSNQRWLSVRLDCIGNLLVLTVGILVVTSRFDVNPSIGGLVLSYILAIVQMIQFTVRQLAEVENNMNATERIHYYATQLDEEAPLKIQQMDPSWPQTGRIRFNDVEMRYRPDLPLVLQGLNLDIQGGERIGIVGRTGAGKSSIMSALFRLTELSSGSIEIDGVDISRVGLHDLRTNLSIIPQDPTLFRGTIRSNLDPFNEHTDLELWSALRQAGLVSNSENESEEAADPEKPSSSDIKKATSSRITLETTVDEEGLNFSLGQRQLMALARALVRNSRIIVCDEATSSVDFETDAKIQMTMARGFKGKTLLCIAHRLKTIINYDRICVMDKGKIAELASPEELYRIEGGIFRSMCERSGITLTEIQRAQMENQM